MFISIFNREPTSSSSHYASPINSMICAICDATGTETMELTHSSSWGEGGGGGGGVTSKYVN